MKQRISSLLLILMVSVGFIRANVVTGTCGQNLDWTYDTNTHSLVITGRGEMVNYYDEGSVPWHTIAGAIISISLPEGLLSIGDYAFSDCSSLASITIPNSVSIIGTRAFSECTRLSSITIPNSVISLGYGAFESCASLTSIVIPGSISVISEYAFYNCYLQDVTIEEGVTQIGRGAFSYNNGLQTVSIPSTMVAIGDNVFQYCTIIYMMGNVPPAITSSSINSSAIIYVPCNSLSSYQNAPMWQFLNLIGSMDYEFTLTANEGGQVHITNSVCAANTVVVEAVPNSGYIFMGWSDGNSDNPRAILLTADKSVQAQFRKDTTTYFVSFSNFDALETYPDGSIIYGSGGTWSGRVSSGTVLYLSAIRSCGTFGSWSDGDTRTYREIVITQDTAISGIYSGIETYQVNITAGEHGRLSAEIDGTITSCQNSFCTTAYPDAGYHFVAWSDGNENANRCFYFYRDSSITAIFAKGDKGGKLGEDVYWSYETDKQQITIDGQGDMAHISRAKKDTGVISFFYELRNVQTIIIEEGITSVKAEIFKNMHHVDSISLPTTITRIEESAFEDCRSLRVIDFALPSNLVEIGAWAFYNCHALQSLNIPEGVTEIGDGAFYGCTYLTNISLPTTMQQMRDNSFALCHQLQEMTVNAGVPPVIQARTFYNVSRSIPVYVPAGSEGSYTSDPYWSEFLIRTAPSGIEEILADSEGKKDGKIIVDGNLYILRNGKAYTVMGQEVR